jgi:hypothetical protein
MVVCDNRTEYIDIHISHRDMVEHMGKYVLIHDQITFDLSK